MAAKTLTAANSVLLLTVAGLFDVPQQLQGFATDDITDLDAVAPAETISGVDGKLSGGWVYVPIVQNIMLQADSDSVRLFEDWYNAGQVARETYIAAGSIFLPAVKRGFVMTKGFLTSYTPLPAVKKVLQPRKFTITWESVTSAALA